MTGHADDEELSAFVDGEAPEWAAHVGSCATCQARVGRLRAVQAMVSAPVEPASPGDRDRDIAAALAQRPGAPTTVGPRRAVRWLAPASIAAVLLLIVGVTSLVVRGGPGPDRNTAAAPAAAPESAAAGHSDNARAGGPAAPPGDLGEIPDGTTLVTKARPALAVADAAKATAAPGPGSVNPGTPAQVGTRPCEEQARAADPSLREVRYFATATRHGAAALVLAFSTGPAPAPVTLLLLAQVDCGVLLRAVGP